MELEARMGVSTVAYSDFVGFAGVYDIAHDSAFDIAYDT